MKMMISPCEHDIAFTAKRVDGKVRGIDRPVPCSGSGPTFIFIFLSLSLSLVALSSGMQAQLMGDSGWCMFRSCQYLEAARHARFTERERVGHSP